MVTLNDNFVTAFDAIIGRNKKFSKNLVKFSSWKLYATTSSFNIFHYYTVKNGEIIKKGNNQKGIK